MGKTRNTTYAGILTNPPSETNDSSQTGNPTPETVPAAALESINQQFGLLFSKLTLIDTDLNALKKQKEKVILQGESSKSGNNDEGDNETPWWTKNPSKRTQTKVDFPKFDGGDPRGWIMKAEKYFRYYQTPEDLKVDVASMYLEGDALDTYSWISSGHEIRYWEELVQILQEQFGPAEFQNPDAHLCAIKQIGSVNDYKQEFVRRSSRVSGWPEHCLLGVFLNGLKDELQADVKIHKPRTVYKAVSLATEIEIKVQSQQPTKQNTRSTWSKGGEYQSSRSGSYYNAQSGTNRGAYFSRANNSSNNNSYYGGNYLGINNSPNNKPIQATVTGIKSISIAPNSDSDRQSRRERGLCYRCGEKYTPGHRCATLKNLEISEEAEDTQPEEENMLCQNEETAEISLHAILGLSSHSTMKVKGMIANKLVMILIDSGSTHNFI